MSDNLKFAQYYLNKAVEELNATPEKSAILDLINACEQLDKRYKDFCEEIDEENGPDYLPTYEDGANVEFYIEGLDWHSISLALRTLRGETDD